MSAIEADLAKWSGAAAVLSFKDARPFHASATAADLDLFSRRNELDIRWPNGPPPPRERRVVEPVRAASRPHQRHADGVRGPALVRPVVGAASAVDAAALRGGGPSGEHQRQPALVRPVGAASTVDAPVVDAAPVRTTPVGAAPSRPRASVLQRPASTLARPPARVDAPVASRAASVAPLRVVRAPPGYFDGR